MEGLLLKLLDVLIPPRSTERVVRSLSVPVLRDLAVEGTLPYHDPRVTALVWELKYYGTRLSASLAGEYLSEELLAAAGEEIGMPLLVPIPMHERRLKERGFNQTELLCRTALRHLPGAVEFAPQALMRVVHTRQQQGLPQAERLRNVKNSMRADGAVVAGRTCVVVDDVTTTGATLAEAKRALLFSGARAVQTISLAKS